MDINLQLLSDSLIQRYSDRYKKLGYSIGTLGWGSKEQQEYRFSISTSLIPSLMDKQILDIGCGFGDFYLFLEKNNFDIKSYSGIDINPDLIQEAKNNITCKNVNFEVFNVLLQDLKSDLQSDFVFMFGLLNFNFKEKMDNFEYTKQFIKKAFDYANESLVFDFISTNVNGLYPKEDFIYYHNPLEVLEYCFQLTPNVSLIHDYQSIPQRECTVILSKSERI
jgi:SAM-dependent methyltransferase